MEDQIDEPYLQINPSIKTVTENTLKQYSVLSNRKEKIVLMISLSKKKKIAKRFKIGKKIS